MLALRSVSVRKGAATLLDGLSLEVAPGEVVAVVGPNGAGKTTALRLMAGEELPTDGDATLDGQPLATLTSSRLAQRRAVLPQASALAFGFSVLDVVLLGRTPHTSTRAEDLDAVERAMRRAGILDLAARRYTTLSGGEKQRVHLARTLAQLDSPLDWGPGQTPASGGGTPAGARYLLLDEPTSALDLAHQHTVLGVARAEAARGIGVLAVLHDLNLAAQYADRIAVLAAGHLVAVGTPEAVLTPTIVHCAFGISVLVTQNPCAACPLVVPIPGTHTSDDLHSSLPILGASPRS
ncbi:MAG: heme ABC transporter ATP-binding protein [Bacteroidota bacterium]